MCFAGMTRTAGVIFAASSLGAIIPGIVLIASGVHRLGVARERRALAEPLVAPVAQGAIGGLRLRF